MAKSNKEIIVRVGANTAEFNKAMKGLNTNMASMQKGMADMGKMMAGAFSVGAIVAFGKAALLAADEQQRANQKLLAALGGRVDVQQRLIAQAEEIRQKTGIDDAVINEVQAFAAAQGRSEKQITKNTAASVQLAAATGIDLLSAMKQVDATMEGNVGRLGKLDARFKDLTTSELENGAAVDLILEKYNGLAESQATSIQLLTSNWGEFQEQAGNALGKVVNPLLEETNKLLNKLNSPDLTWMDKLNSLRGLNFESDFKLAVLQRKKDQVTNIEASDPFKALVAKKVAEKNDKYGYIPPAGSSSTTTVKKSGTPVKAEADAESNFKYNEIEQNIEIYNKYKDIYTKGEKVLTESAKQHLSEVSDATDIWFSDVLKGNVEYNNNKKEQDKEYYDNLSRLQEEAQQKSIEMIQNMNDILKNSIVDATLQMGQGFADMITGDMGIEGLFNTLLSSMGNFLKQMGAAVIAYGITMSAFKKAFANPIAAIVAGAALVIAGGVVSNLAKKGAKMEKGGVVPGGYPNDSYPAMLTSGETVIPAKRLPDFGAQSVEVFGVIRAGDIYLSNKRGEYLQGRKG